MEKNNKINSSDQNSKQFKKVVYINAFIIGAIIMALEMTGSRFLTPYFGSSVYTWASIISMVLLSLAFGYFFGGYLAEKKPNTQIISLLLLLSALFILLIPIYYESLFKWLYNLFNDTKSGGFFGALLTLFFPLLILGMYSPFSVKLLSMKSEKAGKIAGSLYAVSTIGSILGTLGVTFFLIPYIGSKSIAYALSFITFLSAVILYVFSLKKMNSKKLLSITAFILFLILFILIAFNSALAKVVGIKKHKSKYLLEEVESEYNTITIKQKKEYITMSFRRHKAGHIESRINIHNDQELPLSYSQLMQAGLLYQTNPKSLLMLGLGGGMVSSYLKRYYKDIEITGVELDKEVIRLAKKYFNLKERVGFKVIEEDARIFLNNTIQTYDIIMLDAYKGGYIPFHLCTDEFYKLVNEHLNKSGVVVLNLHRGSKLYQSILRTLKNTFKHIDIYPSKTKGNVVVVSYNSVLISEKMLRKNADSLQKVYNFYHNITAVYKHKKQVTIEENIDLLTDDFAPVNFLNAVKEHNQK